MYAKETKAQQSVDLQHDGLGAETRFPLQFHHNRLTGRPFLSRRLHHTPPPPNLNLRNTLGGRGIEGCEGELSCWDQKSHQHGVAKEPVEHGRLTTLPRTTALRKVEGPRRRGRLRRVAWPPADGLEELRQLLHGLYGKPA